MEIKNMDTDKPEKAKIMLVEDEAIVALDIRNRLVALGYNVIAKCASAEECLRIIKDISVDIVLMDITLSGKMDGIEAAAIIKENYDIPVVFLTAHNDENSLHKAKNSSPYGYILKPFEIRDLRNNIEICLYKHKTDKKLIESEKRIQQELQIRLDVQKDLNRMIVEKLENERQRISRELHDSVGQMLFALKFNLEVFAKLSDRKSQEELSSSIKMISDTSMELREIIYSLHPAALDNYGLKAALEKLCGNFSAGNSLKIKYYFEDIPRFDPARELHIYRIVQEAINNIIKHSMANEAEISLRKINDSLDLSISDNGKGFIPDVDVSGATQNYSYGIINMKQRAEILGTEINIESLPDKGTTIFLHIPMEISEYYSKNDE